MNKVGARELFGIIKNIYLNRETGLLVLNFPAGKRLIIFINGNIRYARSGVDGEQLGAFLVQEGHLEEGKLDAHLEAARKAEMRLGEYLIKEGLVSESDVKDTVKKLVQHIVVRPFFEEIEEIDFEQKSVSLDPALMLEISTGNILLEAIRRLDNADFVDAVFDEYADAIPVFMDNPLLLFQKVNLTPTEGFIFSRIDGRMTMKDIEKISSLPHEEFVRTLFGLHLIGLVDFSESQDSGFMEETKDDVMANIMDTAPPKQEAEQVEQGPVELSEEEKAFVEEVEALHKKLDEMTHYDLLEVSFQTSTAIIKKSYYKLMKKYHPDRFSHGREYEDVNRKLDEIVTRLTEAYQTLKDEASRKAYEKSLEQPKPQPETPRQAGGRQTSRKEIHFRDALFFISQSRYGEAIEMLNRCIQIDPKDARFYVELAKLQVHNPMWVKKAEENLQTAIQLDPTQLDAYLLLGQMYLRNERLETARGYYESVLELDPEHEEAKEALERIHKRTHKDKGFISKISDLFS